jgi:hypothetical protein
VRYFARGLREQLRYARWRRLGTGANPYHWRPDARPFEAYGMEQQGKIVEDAFRGNRDAQRLVGLG